jgi:hypothetical protein
VIGVGIGAQGRGDEEVPRHGVRGAEDSCPDAARPMVSRTMRSRPRPLPRGAAISWSARRR